jgi:hypothetical protein
MPLVAIVDSMTQCISNEAHDFPLRIVALGLVFKWGVASKETSH